MKQTLLVIEDDPDIRSLLRDYLEAHGYAVRVADNGQQGLEEARFAPPALVLLDIMMPRMNGLDFLRAFREFLDVPVIVLTAKDTEVDKVLGLELGADDYVTKPFSMAELLARVRAGLRRSMAGGAEERQQLSVGPLTLNLAAHTAQVNGQPAHLTRTEFNLLAAMMQAPGRVFSRLELLEATQADGDELEPIASERTVDVHIRNLRSKLEPLLASSAHEATNARKPKLIQTVFGVGYRLGAGH